MTHGFGGRNDPLTTAPDPSLPTRSGISCVPLVSQSIGHRCIQRSDQDLLLQKQGGRGGSRTLMP